MTHLELQQKVLKTLKRHLRHLCNTYTTHFRQLRHLYNTYATPAAPMRHLRQAPTSQPRHLCDTCGTYATPAPSMRHLRHLFDTCGTYSTPAACAATRRRCVTCCDVAVRAWVSVLLAREFFPREIARLLYGRFPRPPSGGGLRKTPVVGRIFVWRAARFFVLGPETCDSAICQSLDHHYIPTTFFWRYVAGLKYVPQKPCEI